MKQIEVRISVISFVFMISKSKLNKYARLQLADLESTVLLRFWSLYHFVKPKFSSQTSKVSITLVRAF